MVEDGVCIAGSRSARQEDLVEHESGTTPSCSATAAASAGWSLSRRSRVKTTTPMPDRAPARGGEDWLGRDPLISRILRVGLGLGLIRRRDPRFRAAPGHRADADRSRSLPRDLHPELLGVPAPLDPSAGADERLNSLTLDFRFARPAVGQLARGQVFGAGQARLRGPPGMRGVRLHDHDDVGAVLIRGFLGP